MDFYEYQSLAMRTSPEGHDRTLNGCMGLIGEAGEIVDVVKKWRFQSGDKAELPRERLVEECGDLLWYCAETLTGLNQTALEKAFCREASLLEHQAPEKIETACMRIATEAIYPYTMLLEEGNIFDRTLPAVEQISAIMAHVSAFLLRWCNSDLDDCMEKNIKKLKKRYPDGFDPERSLHREA